MLDQKLNEYREKTSMEMSEELKATVLRAIVDPETVKEMRRSKAEEKYDAIKSLIEDLHLEEQNSIYAKPKKGNNDMDVNNLRPGAGSGGEEPEEGARHYY